MATPSSGSQGFSGSEFRDAIHFAMEMGAGLTDAEQVTFYFKPTLTTAAATDGLNVPFNPAASTTASGPDPIRVDCALEYIDQEGQFSEFGILTPSRIAVTLLDEDYEQVKDVAYVVIQGDRYNYMRTEPPQALFDVGVYVMHFKSENES